MITITTFSLFIRKMAILKPMSYYFVFDGFVIKIWNKNYTKPLLISRKDNMKKIFNDFSFVKIVI
jgi:hypothetical protein